MNKFAIVLSAFLVTGAINASPAFAALININLGLGYKPGPVISSLCSDNIICFGPDAARSSGGGIGAGGSTGGAPTPRLASGIPSMIALGVAAFALRRRNHHNDAEDEQITEAGS